MCTIVETNRCSARMHSQVKRLYKARIWYSHKLQHVSEISDCISNIVCKIKRAVHVRILSSIGPRHAYSALVFDIDMSLALPFLLGAALPSFGSGYDEVGLCMRYAKILQRYRPKWRERARQKQREAREQCSRRRHQVENPYNYVYTSTTITQKVLFSNLI